MTEQTFDSTNAARSPYSWNTSLQAIASSHPKAQLQVLLGIRGHAQYEVYDNEHNLVPRYLESKQSDIRLSFFISKCQINLKEYQVDAFPRGIKEDIYM